MDMIKCPVCGAPNPESLERCRACNQLLRQSTSELNGRGELITSGQVPTEKKTAELEAALPAWLRHARQGEQAEEIEEIEETSAPEEGAQAEAVSAPILPDFSEEPEEEDSESEVNPIDWLAGLNGDKVDDDDEEEAADWLINMQGDLAPEPEETKRSDEERSAVDEPIKSNVPPVPADEGEAPPVEEGLPDWISTLQGDAVQNSEALPELFTDEEFSTGGDDGGLPDWLSRLSDEAEAASETVDETPAVQPASVPLVDTTSEPDDSLPNWMADLQAIGEVPIKESLPPSQAAPPATAEDDLPDWMASLRDTESAPLEASAPALGADDLPDWLSGGSDSLSTSESVAEPPQAVAPADDLPDWMASLRDTESAPLEASAPALGADDDLPDWFSGESDSSSTSESVAEPLQAAVPADDLPDWMASLRDTESAPLEASAPALGADNDLPDWFSGESDSSSTSESVAESPQAAAPADDLPDWMASLRDTESAPLTEAAASLVGDDLPDWLASIPTEDFSAKKTETVASSSQETSPEELASPPAFGAFADETLAADEQEVPDWLSRMGKPSAESLSESTPAQAEIFSAFTEDDETEEQESPSWLEDLPAIDQIAQEDEAAMPALSSKPAFVDDSAFSGLAGDDADEIFGIEMPDWLSNLAPDDTELDSDAGDSAAFDAESGDLSGAELPSWVQAMRPVASVVASSTKSSSGEEHVVASTGPLAGLSGILPVAPGMGPKNKPKGHSIKLRVSDSQQSSAALLEEILVSETESSLFQASEKVASIPVVRWLIAFLLFLGVGFSLFAQNNFAPSPNVVVPEIRAAIEAVNQLSGESSVLLIFDYEAGLSAEMQAVAAPLVDHIMLRGEKLAILSTSPMGPALAERFLQETQSAHHYQLGENYLNLGYLPGGATGMQSFVSSPRTSISGELAGVSVWDLPPLAKITKLTDFVLVIVITDDVEKGRSWVEQASATLNDAGIPLLMAISAQAEPIIYPYYASGQVDGLISGLLGGATYERLQGQSGLGRKYWDAYSIGLFLAEILIVVGALINFLAALRARQNNDKDGD